MQVSLLQRILLPLGSGLAIFSFIELDSKYFSFEGCMVSVKTAQLCTYSVIAPVGNIKMNEHGSAPIKLYGSEIKILYVFCMS